MLGLAAEEGLTVRELDFTLAQVYGADEAFVTGEYPNTDTNVHTAFGRLWGDLQWRSANTWQHDLLDYDRKTLAYTLRHDGGRAARGVS